MAVMWRILTRKSHDPKRPGLVGDYVPNSTLAACIDKVDPFGYCLDVAIAENEVEVTPIVLRYMGGLGEGSTTPIGSFLMSYDSEAHGGRGHIEFTDVLDKALRFSSMREAIEFIRQVPKNKVNTTGRET